MKTVLGVFDKRDQAEVAVKELRSHGYEKEISIVAKDQQMGGGHQDRNSQMTGGDSIADGASTGGVLGGLAGLAMGAGALAIPGIGPVIAAGPIAGLLSGAATGGIAGGLIDWGIPQEEADQFEQDVKSGRIVAAVKCSDEKVSQCEQILKNHGASRVKVHQSK